MRKLTDSELIDLIRADNLRQRDQAFAYFYTRYFSMIENLIMKNNGSPEDVKDIFQDGLLVLFHQVVSRRFLGQSKIKTYFYSICRNLWLKRLSKKRPKVEFDQVGELSDPAPDTVSLLIGTEREQRVEKMLEQLGPQCNAILKLFYYDRLSMKEIKEELQLASEQVAKNKKLKCTKRLRSLVIEHPVFKHLLNLNE